MRRLTRVSSGLVVAGLLTAVPAEAQDAPKIGITMAYPASFGIIWHASEKLALRPTVTVGGSSTSSTSTSSADKSWSIGTSIAALFYVKKYDNVRTYVSPSYRYSHGSTTITPSTTVSGTTELGTTSNSNGAAGTFGAEYVPGSRVRIYGEIGFAYARAKQSSPGVSGLNSTANSWGTTAGVGFVFYP